MEIYQYVIGSELQTLEVSQLSTVVRKELMELLKTPDERLKEEQRKEKKRETSREYFRTHYSDPDYKRKKNASSARSRQKRYQYDPVFREKCKQLTREASQRRRVEDVSECDHDLECEESHRCIELNELI